MKKPLLAIIITSLILTSLLISGCMTQSTVSQESGVQPNGTESNVSEEAGPERLVPYADTAIIGRVVESTGPHVTYYEHLIEVDDYLFNDAGDKTIIVRQEYRETRLEITRVLEVGEECLLFLNEEQDYYSIVYEAIFWISNGMVESGGDPYYTTEGPLDEVVANIKKAATGHH